MGDYKKRLRALQIELVELQRRAIAHGWKTLVIFEGRDSSGKDGTIKRLTEHTSPRETRIVALGKPTEREVTQWYFERYAPHLPAAQEFVFFNRSWYNRAGVERVMGFCSDAEYEEFMETVPTFERMLTRSGIRLVKYYLDITEDEQRKRLEARHEDPLKQWKISPIDEVALKHWKDYSRARDAMFERTSIPESPWLVVNANDKKLARLNVIADLLHRIDPKHVRRAPDPAIVFPYEPAALADGRIAR
ncbi:MAG: polyphosphate kinase 2 [bacterium]|nr:polyphosphate kinase 2 [bacterium]